MDFTLYVCVCVCLSMCACVIRVALNVRAPCVLNWSVRKSLGFLGGDRVAVRFMCEQHYARRTTPFKVNVFTVCSILLMAHTNSSSKLDPGVGERLLACPLVGAGSPSGSGMAGGVKQLRQTCSFHSNLLKLTEMLFE